MNNNNFDAKEYFIKRCCGKCECFSPESDDCGFDEYNRFHCNGSILVVEELAKAIDDVALLCGKATEILTNGINNIYTVYCSNINHLLMIVDNSGKTVTMKYGKE